MEKELKFMPRGQVARVFVQGVLTHVWAPEGAIECPKAPLGVACEGASRGGVSPSSENLLENFKANQSIQIFNQNCVADRFRNSIHLHVS